MLCTWKNHPKKQIPLVRVKTSELLINSLVNCYKTETPHAFSWLENCVDYRVCLPRTRDKNKLSVSSADIRRGQKRDEGLDTFLCLGKGMSLLFGLWIIVECQAGRTVIFKLCKTIGFRTPQCHHAGKQRVKFTRASPPSTSTREVLL